MTRFARAKGSKASNEKAPDDATPWEVMKEQLLQAKKENENAKNRQEAEQQRIENYENFLKDRRVQKRPVSWCDFPEAEQNKVNQAEKKKKKNKKTSIKTGNKELVSEAIGHVSDNTEVPKKKKKKNKPRLDNSEFNLNVTESNELSKTANNKTLKKKKSKQSDDVVHSTETEELVVDNSLQKEKKSQKKKKNNKRQSVQTTSDSNVDNDINNASNDCVPIDKDNNFTKQKDKKKNKPQFSQGQNFDSLNTKNINKQNKDKAKKKKKLVDGQPVRRKEINDKSFQLIINGKEVELVRYDGFPVMRKDAERLAELKDSMIKKGIPKSEVQRTMKLERRRAEKALARLRREVCYNCRKGGHNLSDCPELKSKIPGADAPEGVCFKCGSTEHRQFECKVQRDKEFRFATCFICKEPGHIARQCPDNPKGLYPNGGSCKLCGDVTHLRKDCPTASNKKEETSVKLQTLDSTEDLEGIGNQTKPTVSADITKTPKKIRF